MTVKPTLLLTRGLPASGKTTWAREWVAADPDRRVRINRDDFRAMTCGAPYLGHRGEQMVTVVQHAAVRAALASGRSVIVDDTNLRAKYARAWADLAAEVGADLAVEDRFLAVPVDECVARDERRGDEGDRSVGEQVIRDMHARFLAGKKGRLGPVAPTVAKPGERPERYAPDPSLPAAWLFDIDGTLALMEGRRGPYDYDKVSGDGLNGPVADLLHGVAQAGAWIVVMSGRPDSCRVETAEWLRGHRIPYDELHMRKDGDHRKDYVVKAELFDRHVRGRFNARGVVDDRTSVVQMWRGMGLVCAQVADGNF